MPGFMRFLGRWAGIGGGWRRAFCDADFLPSFLLQQMQFVDGGLELGYDPLVLEILPKFTFLTIVASCDIRGSSS